MEIENWPLFKNLEKESITNQLSEIIFRSTKTS